MVSMKQVAYLIADAIDKAKKAGLPFPKECNKVRRKNHAGNRKLSPTGFFEFKPKKAIAHGSFSRKG